MTVAALQPPRTLLDLVPRSVTRDAVAVVGFTLLTAAAAQISIPLGFTPVPLTGQTFAVLLAGGVLGANRGALSQLLYVGLGAIGLPFYADGGSGITTDGALISTFGFLIGFIAAAWVVGLMAERSRLAVLRRRWRDGCHGGFPQVSCYCIDQELNRSRNTRS